MLTRGVKHDVDRFINELSAKYCNFKVYSDKSIMKDVEHNLPAGNFQIPIGVRPIQFWEVVFPEEEKDLVLNTIFKGHHGKSWHKAHHKFMAIIRRVLGQGVEPMGEYKTDKMMAVNTGAVERIAIGIKKDYRFKDGTEGL